MKIAVFGWYGHDNAGDERIKYCLQSFLLDQGGISCVDFYDLHENAIKGATSQFDVYDLVIIGGGGLILSHHNYHDFILGIGTKILTVGISVETELKGNPGKFAKALLQKSFSFLVRDQGSYEKLKLIDINNKIKVSSDLTFLVPYEIANNQGAKNIGINLLPKTRYSPLMLQVFALIARFIPRFNPKPIDFSFAINELMKSHTLLPIPLYCIQQELDLPEYRMNDINYLGRYFKCVPDSFAHTDIDKCKIFLSMRLHGLIFAVQKGIPVLTFSIYPKQVNFMKELGLENFLIKPNQPEKTKEMVDCILKNKSAIKEKIISYRNKAIHNIRNDFIDALNKVS